MELNNLLKRYQRFLSDPVSPLPISIFRILFGTLLLLNALLLYPDLRTWFSEDGVLPTSLANEAFGIDRFSVFWWVGSSLTAVNAVFIIHVLAILALCAGLFTRTAAIVTCATLISFHQRNIYILHSGDTLMRLVSFFMMFADSGAALSFDRLGAVFRGSASAGVHRRINPIPIRLIQLQLCIVYFSTFSWKAMGSMWMSGDAVFVVNQIGQFDRFPIPAFMKSLFFSKVLSWYTLLIEASFPFLVWFKETRLYILAAMLLLHVGLEYTLNIQLFQPTICSIFVLFLTEAEWLRTWGWVSAKIKPRLERFEIVAFYDGTCGFCKQSVNVLQAVDCLRLIEWINSREPKLEKGYEGFSRSKSENEILALTSTGQWLGGFFAMRSLAMRTPLLLPLALLWYFPIVPLVGSAVYAYIAKRRHLISIALKGSATCQVVPPQKSE